MSEQIKRSDIAEVDVFKHIIDGGKQAEAVISKLNEELKESARINKQMLSKTTKFANATEIKEAEKQMKLANLQYKEKAKLEVELTKIQAQRIKAETQLKTAQERQAKATQKQTNAYKDLVIKTRDLKNESKRLGVELLNLEREGKRNSAEYRKLANEYRNVTNQASRFDKQLKNIDSRVGDNFRNVGNYGSAIGKLKSTLLQFTAGFGVVTLFRESFNVIKDFDQGVANLASVLGKTRSEIVALEQDAKRLGATTKFTASEVAQLQTEYAKLGFSQQEILNATESTLALAGATGTDLARSAEVAGATLRGFGLDASEMQRVVDVMAKSFSTSALDTEKFAESMKFVAPVAKVAGLSIEETTAMLGALADSGIKGSQAGTALRQVISQLDKTGKTTSEALKDLATKGLDLAGAEEEVGKNAKTALLVLADQTKHIDELTVSYNDAEGSAQKMAETQLNTLGGSLALLRSAFEGYILNLSESTNAGNGLTKTIKFLADNFEKVGTFIVKAIKWFLLYKGTMLVVKGLQILFNAEMRKSIFSFKELGNSVRNADGSVSKFGNALKGVGWSVAIGMAVELGQSLWNVAKGYDVAERRARSFNEYQKFANVLVEKKISAIQKEIDENDILLQQLVDKGKLTEEQARQEQKAFLNRKDFAVEEANWYDRQVKTVYKSRIDLVKDLIKEENTFKKGKLAEINILKKDGEFKNRLTIADKKASIDASNEKIKKYYEYLDLLNSGGKVIIKATETQINNDNKIINSSKKVKKEYKDAREELEKLRKEEEDFENKRKEEELELVDAVQEAERTILMSGMTEQEKEEFEVIQRYKRARDLAEGNAEALEVIENAMKNEINEIRLKFAKESEKTTEDSQKKQFETIKQWSQLTTDFFIQQSERRIEQLDKEIARREQNYSRLEELAKNGNITAQQSLAEEQRLIQEANRKKIEEQKRIERIKLAQTTLDIYSSKVDAGDKTPLISTIKDVALIRQFISSLPAFESGTENTGQNGRGIDGKGGFLSVLHPNERVMTSEQNDRVGNLTNEDLSKIAMKYNAGQIVDVNRMDKAGNSYDLIPLLKEIKGLKQTIENRPTHNIELGEITQSLMQIVQTTKQGNKTTTNRFNIRK